MTPPADPTAGRFAASSRLTPWIPLFAAFALLAGSPAGAADPKPAPATEGPHPAIAKRVKEKRPLPWAFPVFQLGGISSVDRESRYLLESLLRGARPGSTIRIAARRWDRYWNRGAATPHAAFPLDRFTGPDCWPPLAEAINRGVDVAVVANGRRQNEAVVNWLRDPSAPSNCPVPPAAKRGQTRVKQCTRPPKTAGGACLGDGDMLSSFFTFEHVDVDGVDLHSVVAISGASYDHRQLHQGNDWIVVVGDRSLFDALNLYFEAMYEASNDAPSTGWKGIAAGESFRHDAIGGMRSAASDAAGAESAVELSFSPRGDFVQLETLSQVKCDPSARIRIAMASPSAAPGGASLLDAARRLARAGCQVEALLREKSEEESQALIKRVAADKLSVVAVPKTSGVFFNSRLLLIDAMMGDVRRRLVYTGGASFDPSSSAQNDEILVAIEDDEVFRRYDRHLDLLCTRLNCRIGPAD